VLDVLQIDHQPPLEAIADEVLNGALLVPPVLRVHGELGRADARIGDLEVTREVEERRHHLVDARPGLRDGRCAGAHPECDGRLIGRRAHLAAARRRDGPGAELGGRQRQRG